jgi:oxygen-independent coproporphyrinogen-3 oxidase
VAGRRWSNVKHPTTYAKYLAENKLPSIDGEDLSNVEQQEERAMLELRLRDGLSLDVVRALNENHAKAISELVASNLIYGRSAIQGSAVLTLQGRLLADFVLRKLLGL